MHGPDDSVPDIQRPTRIIDCYPLGGALEDAEVVNRILANGNVAAINYSGGSTTKNCNTSSELFKDTVNQGIALIAAVGNGGANTRVAHPACNPHVIAVGSTDFLGESIKNYTNQVGNIDFFANDFISDAYTDAPTQGTSYAAPKIAGAFATVRQALLEAGVPTSPEVVAQAKFALTTAAFNLGKSIIHTNPQTGEAREVPIIDFLVIAEAVRCVADGSCLIDTGNGIFDQIDYFDGGQYGSTYGDLASSDYSFDIDFDNLAVGFKNAQGDADVSSLILAKSSSSDAPSERDVVLSFDSKMASNSFNGLKIYINGSQRKSIPIFLNEKSFSFVFNRKLFGSGKNTIRIEPTFSSRNWGISNVKAEFTPIVRMNLNEVNSNEYGSDETPERPSGMRISFELESIQSDIQFSVRSKDVSSNDELTIYINGTEHSNLSKSPITGYNAGDLLTFVENDLLVGLNVIEIVQKSGAVRWGVKDMIIAGQGSKPTLQLGDTLNGQYGNNYGTNQHVLTLEAEFQAMVEHDHVFSWSAYDIESFGDLDVYVNNSLIKSVNTSGNARLGAKESITVPWRLLKSGTNKFSFRAKANASDDTWGVTNLLVKTSTVVDLDNEANLEKDYGYFAKYRGPVPVGWTRRYSTQPHHTRLYATFNSTATSDKIIQITGWDVDTPEELAIYVNGTFLRYVNSEEASSIYSKPEMIRIPKSELRLGQNTISFRTNILTGFNSEKWGVFFGRGFDVSITPVLYLLLE